MVQGSGFRVQGSGFRVQGSWVPISGVLQREFFIDNLLVRIHVIIGMNRWTGLAPWEFEFPFPGSLTSTFLVHASPLLSIALDCSGLLRRNVKRFRGGLVFKAHRLVYHSTLGLPVIKKRRRTDAAARC